jgi:outer membrane murein-binding lipoprotein Lpp
MNDPVLDLVKENAELRAKVADLTMDTDILAGTLMRANAAEQTVQKLRVKVTELTALVDRLKDFEHRRIYASPERWKEMAGWESDARTAKANWDAACQDIEELQAKVAELETIIANIRALCSQENHDGYPWDEIYKMTKGGRND